MPGHGASSLTLLVGPLLLGQAVTACAPAEPATSRNLRAGRLAQLETIAAACGLPAETLKLAGSDDLHFKPPPDSEYEQVDCVLKALRKTGIPMKMGFVGNEAYDPGNQQ
jgi:hypothetical protein